MQIDYRPAGVSATRERTRWRYWRFRVFLAAWILYAAYYFCRKNFSVIMPMMARIHGIETETLDFAENRVITPDAIAARLASAPVPTHVALIHVETTPGILNPIAEIGEAVHRPGAAYIVDAMSSFGAVPIDLAGARIDFLISSANKCIEGVPGFGFVLARRAPLLEAQGRARTLSLDLHAQWAGLESDGQFRFTPPTHALLAFHQALLELESEGGGAGRARRYALNYATLMRGMTALGFEAHLAPADRSYIITSFRYPAGPRFRFEEFYARLSDRGFLVYPGKLSQEMCFRVGTIGRLYPADIKALLDAIGRVLIEMGVGLAGAAART